MTDCNKIFLDTAPLIYFLDEASLYHNTVKKIFSSLFTGSNSFILTTITCMEYLVLPYRASDQAAVQALWDFVTACNIQIVSINQDVAIQAAKIRASIPTSKLWMHCSSLLPNIIIVNYS
ncbi:PIN domain-containing protein [Selenomonas sp. KH1T6]|uniref:type II toxin-antitoxin system VapC family toxin n=1 Tax=Selenomonas sp. KH1T6 TaxID=3158784 RepID=UPI0015875A8B